MAETYENEQIEEKVILVGISEQDGDDAEDSLAELAELVKTAGAVVVGTLIQKRETIHPGTYVGTGKVDEIAQLLAATGATGIVCDDELSPAQMKNLESILATKVMDRTLIILDIFAARATTSEGKIQVELAQLKYRLSRLSGLGKSMSRLGGGIGTRGPGEKKLEIDRRLINDRIAQLNRELKEVVKHRDITRAKREKNDVPVVAIVGYTNAGKSTLLHVLAGIDSFESGSYHVGNQDVGQMSEKQLAEFRNKSIGMVMQDFALIEEYTVQENLQVPLIFGKVKKREQSKKIMDVLEKVNIAELKDKRVNQLSGGQKQRVAIARALINSPEYILADEPTGALDSNTSDDIMDVFEELNRNGHTVIIVTHDNGVAARCQRVIEIKDGEVLSE